MYGDNALCILNNNCCDAIHISSDHGVYIQRKCKESLFKVSICTINTTVPNVELYPNTLTHNRWKHTHEICNNIHVMCMYVHCR